MAVVCILALLTALLAVSPGAVDTSALSYAGSDVALQGGELPSANMTAGQPAELEEKEDEEKEDDEKEDDEKKPGIEKRMMNVAYWSTAGFVILSLACPPGGSYAVVVAFLFFIVMIAIHYYRLNEGRKDQFKKDFVQKWYLHCCCPCLLVYIILFVPVYTIVLDEDKNDFCQHAKEKYEGQITWGLTYFAAWVAAIVIVWAVHYVIKGRMEQLSTAKKAGVYLGFFLGSVILAFIAHFMIQAMGVMPLMIVTFVVFAVCLCRCFAAFENKVMAGDQACHCVHVKELIEKSKAEVDLKESLVLDVK